MAALARCSAWLTEDAAELRVWGEPGPGDLCRALGVRAEGGAVVVAGGGPRVSARALLVVLEALRRGGARTIAGALGFTVEADGGRHGHYAALRRGDGARVGYHLSRLWVSTRGAGADLRLVAGGRWAVELRAPRRPGSAAPALGAVLEPEPGTELLVEARGRRELEELARLVDALSLIAAALA